MDWQTLIRKLCALRDALALDPVPDAGHPVFMALDRTAPGMSKEAYQFADNVIQFYSGEIAGNSPVIEGRNVV